MKCFVICKVMNFYIIRKLLGVYLCKIMIKSKYVCVNFIRLMLEECLNSIKQVFRRGCVKIYFLMNNNWGRIKLFIE